MSLKESKGNQIIGTVFFVLGLLFFFVIVPSQTTAVENAIITPSFFPRTFSLLMAILGALLFIEGWRGKDKPNQKVYSVSKQGLKLVIITFAILIAYVLLLYRLPYIAVTIPVLAVLIYIYGQRNWIKLIGVSVGLPIVIYFSFTYLLRLMLP